jgi:hypothetical protein
VAIDSYEGPRKKSESVEARYPDDVLSDFRSEITTSEKKAERPRNRFLSSGSVRALMVLFAYIGIIIDHGRLLAKAAVPIGHGGWARR